MERKNKKDNIAALHKQNIMNAAELVFSEKGFNHATINDISKAADYSRRTIYAYFDSKEDIYNHIVLKGLRFLMMELSEGIAAETDFIQQYHAVCKAMTDYYTTSPHSFDAVNQLETKKIDFNHLPKIVSDIFVVGEEINRLLEDLITDGMNKGVIKADVKVKETVSIIWSCISAILILVKNKGSFIEVALQTTVDSFLNYAFNQIINSILEERI